MICTLSRAHNLAAGMTVAADSLQIQMSDRFNIYGLNESNEQLTEFTEFHAIKMVYLDSVCSWPIGTAFTCTIFKHFACNAVCVFLLSSVRLL